MTARRVVAVALAAAGLFAACGDDDPQPASTATPTPTRTATPTPTPEAAPPDAPKAHRVRFTATDGERVRGLYTPAARRSAPAVVLLHEIRGGPDQWDPLVPYLHDAGFATLAPTSRASAIESERLPDALGALRWLRRQRGVDRNRVGLVGASIGASTVVLAMATDARATARAAVALSPPDSADIWALQDDDRYRPHDVLFIADEREAVASEGMLDGAVRSRLLTAGESGHGVALLPQPHVREALLAWLSERVAGTR